MAVPSMPISPVSSPCLGCGANARMLIFFDNICKQDYQSLHILLFDTMCNSNALTRLDTQQKHNEEYKVLYIWTAACFQKYQHYIYLSPYEIFFVQAQLHLLKNIGYLFTFGHSPEGLLHGQYTCIICIANSPPLDQMIFASAFMVSVIAIPS